MTLQYGLMDARKLDNFQKMSKEEYTFDNGKFEVGSAVLRINKFIVFQDLDSRGGESR
jgi:hypothetical protein